MVSTAPPVESLFVDSGVAGGWCGSHIQPDQAVATHVPDFMRSEANSSTVRREIAMKRILFVSLVTTLFLGFVAGALMVPPTPALALYCDVSDGSFYYSKEMYFCPDTLEGVDMVAQYYCEGRVLGTMKPCNCTFIGCIVDPYGRPANQAHN